MSKTLHLLVDPRKDIPKLSRIIERLSKVVVRLSKVIARLSKAIAKSFLLKKSNYPCLMIELFERLNQEWKMSIGKLLRM